MCELNTVVTFTNILHATATIKPQLPAQSLSDHRNKKSHATAHTMHLPLMTTADYSC